MTRTFWRGIEDMNQGEWKKDPVKEEKRNLRKVNEQISKAFFTDTLSEY